MKILLIALLYIIAFVLCFFIGHLIAKIYLDYVDRKERNKNNGKGK